MVIRLCLQEFGSGVPVARWPLRLAPIVLSAAVLTVVAFVEALEDGPIGGLAVMPPLILWGAAAGEWVVHRWLARGRDASRLFGRFFLFAFAGIAWLAIARWVLNTPRAEQALAREQCEGAYARALTPADSARLDHWNPEVAGRTWERPCGALRLAAAPRRGRGRVGYYTWRRLRGDLLMGNGMAAVLTGVALLPVVLLGVVNALESVYGGALVMRWTSLALFFCVLSASYFVAGNLAAVAMWLLRPLRTSGIAGVLGYALTGGVIAAIAYPVVALSVELLGRARGDLSTVGATGQLSWVYYRDMAAAFGFVGLCGGVWWWFKERTAGD